MAVAVAIVDRSCCSCSGPCVNPTRQWKTPSEENRCLTCIPLGTPADNGFGPPRQVSVRDGQAMTPIFPKSPNRRTSKIGWTKSVRLHIIPLKCAITVIRIIIRSRRVPTGVTADGTAPFPTKRLWVSRAMRRNSDNLNEKRFRRERQIFWFWCFGWRPRQAWPRQAVSFCHQISSEQHKTSSWHEFLAGGPAHWSHAPSPKIGTAIHHIMNHAMKNARPHIETERQLLDVAAVAESVRFDHYHPRVGRELLAMLTPTTALNLESRLDARA